MKNRPRTCLGCRKKLEKSSLFRVARIIGDDGMKTIKFDFGAKLQGRGAWVCRNRECIEKAMKTRAFERILKVQATKNVYEELLCVTI